MYEINCKFRNPSIEKLVGDYHEIAQRFIQDLHPDAGYVLRTEVDCNELGRGGGFPPPEVIAKFFVGIVVSGVTWDVLKLAIKSVLPNVEELFSNDRDSVFGVRVESKNGHERRSISVLFHGMEAVEDLERFSMQIKDEVGALGQKSEINLVIESGELKRLNQEDEARDDSQDHVGKG